MKPNPVISKHKPVIHGGNYSNFEQDSDILDFSSNINPLGPSPQALKSIWNNIKTISKYPDSDSKSLKKTLEKFTKIPSSQIVVGNGATEIIYNFGKSFLSEKTPVLIPIPTFGEYESAAKLAGAKINYFKTMDLKNDINKFISKIPKHGCIFVCNPNNPIGYLLSKNDLEKIVKNAKKKKTLVFLDECFIELVPRNNESLISSLKRFDNLIILRSLTKSFALAGMRIGYAVGPKRLISILNNIKIPWNVSYLAQFAAIASLETPKYLDKSKKLIQKESNFLKNKISKLENFQCSNSTANFILVKSKINSATLQKKLLEKNLLIRDCSNFKGLNSEYIRIAVKTRKENLKLIKALEEI